MPVQCGTVNGKIQHVSCKLSLYCKEFLPDMRQCCVIHLYKALHTLLRLTWTVARSTNCTDI